jgi:hypothetical protein
MDSIFLDVIQKIQVLCAISFRCFRAVDWLDRCRDASLDRQGMSYDISPITLTVLGLLPFAQKHLSLHVTLKYGLTDVSIPGLGRRTAVPMRSFLLAFAWITDLMAARHMALALPLIALTPAFHRGLLFTVN